MTLNNSSRDAIQARAQARRDSRTWRELNTTTRWLKQLKYFGSLAGLNHVSQ